MAKNRGKIFEKIIREAFESVPDVSVDRIHDQTTGYKGSTNICDFIVYKKPYEYYIECKTVQGNTLPFSNISDNQWKGLLDKSKIEGVIAGVVCWWVDKDVTKFIPIQELEQLKSFGYKSMRFDVLAGWPIEGKKKRVFYVYDMEQFLWKGDIIYEYLR